MPFVGPRRANQDLHPTSPTGGHILRAIFPILVMHGGEDGIIPAWQGKLLAETDTLSAMELELPDTHTASCLHINILPVDPWQRWH